MIKKQYFVRVMLILFAVLGIACISQATSMDDTNITLYPAGTYAIVGDDADPVLDTTESHYRTVSMEDGVAITGYTGSERNLIFPDQLNGQPVVQIGSDRQVESFEWCDFISVVIPEGVSNIGIYAFARCTTLRMITLPFSIASFPSVDTVFEGCDLSSFTIVAPQNSRAMTFAQRNKIPFMAGTPPTRLTASAEETIEPIESIVSTTLSDNLNFVVSAYSSTGVDVSWNSVPGAKEYTVQIRRNRVFTDAKTFDGSKTSGKISGLTKGATFTFRLKATLADGNIIMSCGDDQKGGQGKVVETLFRVNKPTTTQPPDTNTEEEGPETDNPPETEEGPETDNPPETEEGPETDNPPETNEEPETDSSPETETGPAESGAIIAAF